MPSDNYLNGTPVVWDDEKQAARLATPEERRAMIHIMAAIYGSGEHSVTDNGDGTYTHKPYAAARASAAYGL